MQTFGSCSDTRLGMAGRYPALGRRLQARAAGTGQIPPRGLGGLAQTYAKMGRDEEARQLFLKVAAAQSQRCRCVCSLQASFR